MPIGLTTLLPFPCGGGGGGKDVQSAERLTVVALRPSRREANRQVSPYRLPKSKKPLPPTVPPPPPPDLRFSAARRPRKHHHNAGTDPLALLEVGGTEDHGDE